MVWIFEVIIKNNTIGTFIITIGVDINKLYIMFSGFGNDFVFEIWKYNNSIKDVFEVWILKIKV